MLHTDNYKRFCWKIRLNSRKKGKAQEFDSWPSKMVPIGRPETSVRNYDYPLCNSPEERKSHAHRGGNLKSRKGEVVCKNALKAYGGGRSIAPLVLSQSVHGTATYRFDDTRDCIIQFCPPDDEHMCSKHVEA